MPISKYFKGSGEKVMQNLTSEYGPKKGKSVFYALSNSRKGMKPQPDQSPSMPSRPRYRSLVDPK